MYIIAIGHTSAVMHMYYSYGITLELLCNNCYYAYTRLVDNTLNKGCR